jgi:hypothetical protein
MLDTLRDAYGARRRLDSELRHKGVLEREETVWGGPLQHFIASSVVC